MDYGTGGVQYSFPATNSAGGTGASPGGAEREDYYFVTGDSRQFNNVVKKVRIQLLSTASIRAYVKWNRVGGTDGASATSWDVELAAGDSIESPPGCAIENLSIYFTGAATFGTDFTVRGWI